MHQIEKDYDGQWVFMINCTQKNNGTILGGEVVLNSESRAKVVRSIKDAKNKSLTFFGYVGKAPEGVAYL
jgi:uncharacterized protein YegP (UPF0339 family)